MSLYTRHYEARKNRPKSRIARAFSGKPLLLYLSVTETTMGSMLAQYDEDRRKERAIYYLSKKMTDYETRYTNLKKTCLALVRMFAV